MPLAEEIMCRMSSRIQSHPQTTLAYSQIRTKEACSYIRASWHSLYTKEYTVSRCPILIWNGKLIQISSISIYTKFFSYIGFAATDLRVWRIFTFHEKISVYNEFEL